MYNIRKKSQSQSHLDEGGNSESSQRSRILHVCATASSENIILSPRASVTTPIRLNSPHMSVLDLNTINRSIVNGPQYQQSSLSSHCESSQLANETQILTANAPTTAPTTATSTSTSTITINNPTPTHFTQMPHLTNLENEVESITSPPPLYPSTPNSVGLDLEVMPTSSLFDLPTLVHKWTHRYSILCCIASPKNNLLFGGTQDGKVLVFDMLTYSLKMEINRDGKGVGVGAGVGAGEAGEAETETEVEAEAEDESHHINSVLTMTLNKNEDILFIGGSDSLVKVYSIKNGFICTHVIYSLVDIGDIFSLVWCEKSQTIYIGAQNASILWCKVGKNEDIKHARNLENLPRFRYDKFFDSKGPGGSQNTLQTKHELLRKRSNATAEIKHNSNDGKNGGSRIQKFVESKHEDIVRFAHNGYVYCLEIVVDTVIGHFDECTYLISGGGDGVVNIWSMGKTLTKLTSLQNDESVLSMTIQNSLLYVGLGDSFINVWDLMTLQMIRSFQFEDCGMNEVLSIGVHNDSLFKACTTSGLVKLTMKYKDVSNSVLMSRQSEDGVTNTVSIFRANNETYLLAGGNKSLTLWNISEKDDSNEELIQSTTTSNSSKCTRLTDNDLLSMLKKYISYKTISKNPELYLEDSRHCAQFLSKLLNNFGAYQTKLLPVHHGNPIVFSEFKRNANVKTNGERRVERVLFYAHYDVVDATRHEAKDWSTNPFLLTAKEGNLYARGVSDNKGPTLAAIYAVAELYSKEELSCDVVFVIEGEEECGSIGFQEVIQQHKSSIGDIDWVLLSNSYWLDDITPCLNYGLRGVINANVTIKSDRPDRHSGVDGGISREPVMDMMHVLSTLMDPITQEIKIDGFYNDILPLTQAEQELYNQIKQMSNTAIDVDVLKSKWRQPSLTIHKIQVSGPNNNTVIPQVVKATISMRIVPNQDLSIIKQKLIDHLNIKFNQLKSDNHLQVEIFHEAEPWLGNPKNKVYSILYKKIQHHWQQEPLFIREGGSIPSVRFLEKCFNAPAAQIPCGQSSDNAHLKDEKLRVVNLFKLRSILADTLREIGS
ncbi:hypothetical protein KGF56_000133 [Candida oxycetoniae]|uniref:Peptidase M20 dimerisation domain-containing protein n=1 Tax=Candida oxycetoniae TaxID=497107 RepID=A0AAI9X0G9_9ASCO|nr:uncharacterized protein KGF56_000133 [Candida oxycetoniae]KAI3407045.2 hypothetical protein KGF56_000133 [Candida oxycetoniae]